MSKVEASSKIMKTNQKYIPTDSGRNLKFGQIHCY
jgi:hypothetical protein